MTSPSPQQDRAPGGVLPFAQRSSTGRGVARAAQRRHHLSDSVLEHAARLLLPGGRLVFAVPTEAFSQWLMLPIALRGVAQPAL